MTDLETANAAFERGDYRTARKLYSQFPRDEFIDQRLRALKTDKLALGLGAGTLAFIVIAYVWSRLAN